MEDEGEFGGFQTKFDTTWQTMRVHYHKDNCTQYMKTAVDINIDDLEHSYYRDSRYSYFSKFYREGDGSCRMGNTVICSLHDPVQSKCRLNVRMSAAFVLMSCLVIKAVYMCAVNLLARGKLKEHCLTFGDVIVASASNPELRVQGYVRRVHSRYTKLTCRTESVWSMLEITFADLIRTNVTSTASTAKYRLPAVSNSGLLRRI
jgi:hypothetical protein